MLSSSYLIYSDIFLDSERSEKFLKWEILDFET